MKPKLNGRNISKTADGELLALKRILAMQMVSKNAANRRKPSKHTSMFTRISRAIWTGLLKLIFEPLKS